MFDQLNIVIISYSTFITIILIPSRCWTDNGDVVKMLAVFFSIKSQTGWIFQIVGLVNIAGLWCSLSFYLLSIFTSILNKSFLTNTKFTPKPIADIHCINHTIFSLLIHSNIIWSTLRTRSHFYYFHSFRTWKKVEWIELLYDSWDTHLLLKRMRRKSIICIYKTNFNTLRIFS